jgi:EmrB/QacA subfamily drug resistance transporter
VEERRRQRALLAAIMGSFVVGLDATVVNVALPAIEDDLGGGLAGQQWVANAYLLALGSLILIGGSLGDIFGERRMFSLGVAGFGLVSAVCAVAPSIELLIAGRALQGVFGALLTPSALAVIVTAFPPEQRGGAIGSWTAWSGIAMVIGPLAGGWLIDAASWRWIFAINVPFVLVTLAIVAAGVPRRATGTSHPPVDWPGAALTALGLAGPVLALIRQPEVGWGSPQVWGFGVGGLALLALFVLREARTANPMLPLALFARRNFAVGNAQTLAMYAGLSVMFFLLVVFLQQVAGYDALQAGLATMPPTLVMLAFSKQAGALADRFGPRRFMGGGPLVAAAGLALMATLDADVDYVTEVLPGLLLFSIGLSATVAPLTATVLADADERNAGIASGVNNAIARVAGLLGVAALGALIAAQFNASLDASLGEARLGPQASAVVEDARARGLARLGPEHPPALRSAVTEASVEAYRLGMGSAAVLVGLGGVLGLIGIRDPRRTVRCADCAGGQLAGQPVDAARPLPVPPGRVPAPASAGAQG